MESAWTHCELGNNGSQVDLGASNTTPGDRPSNPRGDGPRGGGSAQPESPAVPDCPNPGFCVRPEYSVISFPDVTLADLASFRPATPTLAGEPAGFGVVGMPANIVAAASEQRIPGTLFGWDVVVRFVPARYDFDFGDGSTSSAATGGATWAQLGQAQFTPTATSHAYRARGTYSASVTVRYSASVDFGTGWRPVAGYVSATAGGYGVRVVEVRTALVDRTCIENPGGPGC